MCYAAIRSQVTSAIFISIKASWQLPFVIIKMFSAPLVELPTAIHNANNFTCCATIHQRSCIVFTGIVLCILYFCCGAGSAMWHNHSQFRV